MELSDEDVAKLLAKDIDQHKSKVKSFHLFWWFLVSLGSHVAWICPKRGRLLRGSHPGIVWWQARGGQDGAPSPLPSGSGSDRGEQIGGGRVVFTTMFLWTVVDCYTSLI